MKLSKESILYFSSNKTCDLQFLQKDILFTKGVKDFPLHLKHFLIGFSIGITLLFLNIY
jgi:hypothetical protein